MTGLAGDDRAAIQAEWDTWVLAHVTRYPGLSSYQIARALGLEGNYGRGARTSLVEKALARMAGAGKAEYELVPGPYPGGYKRIWKAKDPA